VISIFFVNLSHRLGIFSIMKESRVYRFGKDFYATLRNDFVVKITPL